MIYELLTRPKGADADLAIQDEMAYMLSKRERCKGDVSEARGLSQHSCLVKVREPLPRG
jgi:hypothetical protein